MGAEMTSIRFVCCFLVGAGITLCSAASDTVVLENSHVRMVFATKPVPALRSLVHKPSGTALLAGPKDSALFALQVTLSNGVNATVESGQAKQGTATVTPVGGVQQVRLTFEGLGAAGDVRVVLDGRLDDAEPYVRWSVALENPSRLRLTSLRFPTVDAVPAIGSPDDDFLIGPALPGVMIENPNTNWPAYYSLSWRFPGDQSAQFCSYQDRTAGVYLASMDTAGYGRSLTISKRKNLYQLSQEYLLPEEPAARWKSPYDTALGVTSGHWQQTADLYKRWAVRQTWCAKTLVQRDDVPAFWKRGCCIHTCEVRTYGTNRLCSGSYYPELPAHLRALRDRIGGPVVPMLPGWENHRRWTAGAYFPVFDAPRATATLGQLRQDGLRPFVYLSGLFFTFQNEGRDGGDISGWKQVQDSLVIEAGPEKKLKTYVLDESSPGTMNVWKRHSYQFCPAASGTRDFFCSVIDQLHALGIDIVQMDQTTTGAGDLCHSAAHGHAPGRGVYQSQAFRDLLAAMRRRGQSQSREFMLAHEEPHEELIPYVDAFHTREYRERWWYHGAPGARSIPLFTYLYHEYAIAYGGEGPGASAKKDPRTVRDMAVNLVTGKTPAVSVWSNQKAMAEAHADQIRMLRNHMTLLRTEAQRFLTLGRMLHSLEFDVPAVTFQIPARREGKWVTEPFVERAALTSSWQSPEGNIGHCLVNITDTNQTVRLQLDTRNAPAWAKTDVALYRAGSAEGQPLCRGVALPLSYTLELEPLEAVFFVLRPHSCWSRFRGMLPFSCSVWHGEPAEKKGG